MTDEQRIEMIPAEKLNQRVRVVDYIRDGQAVRRFDGPRWFLTEHFAPHGAHAVRVMFTEHMTGLDARDFLRDVVVGQVGLARWAPDLLHGYLALSPERRELVDALIKALSGPPEHEGEDADIPF